MIKFVSGEKLPSDVWEYPTILSPCLMFLFFLTYKFSKLIVTVLGVTEVLNCLERLLTMDVFITHRIDF